MPRVVGTPKTGGRRRGTPNKSTSAEAFKGELRVVGIDLLEQIATVLPTLPPDQKMRALLDLLSFMYPRQKAVDISGDQPQATQCSTCAKISGMTPKQQEKELGTVRQLRSDLGND